MLTADVIDVTITGKKLPLVNPVNVTSVVFPTGLTVIDVVVKSGFVTAPIYIAADLISLVGYAEIVSTLVAKSG
jgi:acetaldehyde dehydrogenase (acetylating)